MITNKNKFLQSINEDKLRSIKVDFENGDTITTNMAAHLTDEEMLDYYQVGKIFNLGNGPHDNLSKVKSAEILENKINEYGFDKDGNPYGFEHDDDMWKDQIENDLYDVIVELPGIQTDMQLQTGVEEDTSDDGNTILLFYKELDDNEDTVALEGYFRQLVSIYDWSDLVSVEVNDVDSVDYTDGKKEVCFTVNLNDNITEAYDEKGIDKSELQMLKNIYKNKEIPEHIKKRIEQLENDINESISAIKSINPPVKIFDVPSLVNLFYILDKDNNVVDYSFEKDDAKETAYFYHGTYEPFSIDRKKWNNCNYKNKLSLISSIINEK